MCQVRLCSAPGGREMSLPASRQVHSVDWGEVRQDQLELCKQREVIGGDVGVWTASDVVFQEPISIQGSQDPQHIKLRLREEDVINDTLQMGRGEKKRLMALSPSKQVDNVKRKPCIFILQSSETSNNKQCPSYATP